MDFMQLVGAMPGLRKTESLTTRRLVIILFQIFFELHVPTATYLVTRCVHCRYRSTLLESWESD